jgi:Mn-dependent DtxR family transcriptional regulator
MSDATHYLLAVYVAQRRQLGAVPSGHVAEVVGRSPAATTEALQRLEARGFLEYEPYEGVELTEEGRETAEDAYETFVTLVRFFRDVLDLDDYETEALAAVGTVDATVAERISTVLLSEDDEEFDPPSILTPENPQ